MSSIVLKLQQDAMEKIGSVSDLLRKAYTIARKLKNTDFALWAKKELEGYSNDTVESVPDYRKVRGRLRAFNPFRGWIPAELTADFAEFIEQTKIGESVPEIEHLLTESGDYLIKHFPADYSSKLSELFQFQTQFQLIISRSEFEGILNNLRQAVLEWALQLEEDGILGDGIEFSEQEKQVAVQNQYHVNVNGAGSQIQIQQSTTNSNQSIVESTHEIDLDKLKQIAEMIRGNLGQAGIKEEEQTEIISELSVLDEQIKSGSPKKMIVEKSLKFIVGVLEKAAGSLVASGMIHEIGKFLG